MVVMATNLSYCIIGPITNAATPIRIIIFILEIILYGLSITMYTYIFLENTSDAVLGITITVMILNLISFIMSIVSK